MDDKSYLLALCKTLVASLHFFRASPMSITEGRKNILAAFFCLVSLQVAIAADVPPPPSVLEHEYDAKQFKVAPSTLPTQTLSIGEAIVLALRHNRTIKNAYLQRISQKWSLYVASDEFRPDLSINVTTGYADDMDKSTDVRTRTHTFDFSPTASLKLRTGGTLSAAWNNSYSKSQDTVGSGDIPSHTSGISLNFTQPLLKGSGQEVAQASQIIAERAEQVNLLNLKSTLISTITSVIQSYREVIQAKRAYEISKNSLKRSRKLLEVNTLLIESGRMAAVESIQAEADLARGELDLRISENALDAARLNLLRILDIDKHTKIDIIEALEIEEVDLNFEKLKTVAFSERVDYLQAKLGILDAKLNLVLAKNNKLWELGLFATYDNSLTDRSSQTVSSNLGDISAGDYAVGLALKIPFGDHTPKQNIANARVSLQTQQTNLIELKDEILIGLEDSIRDIKNKYEQVRLAKRSRELARKTLEIENEKLRAGRSSNFELVSFQNALVAAENSEVNANIVYLNALSSLDQFLGTTLDTWGIAIQDVTRFTEINEISEIRTEP